MDLEALFRVFLLSFLSWDPQMGKTVGVGHRRHKLYFLEYLHLPESIRPRSLVGSLRSSKPSTSLPANLWHRRLGHVSNKRLKSLIQSGVLGPVSSSSSIESCTYCKLAKFTALPFKMNTSSTSLHNLVKHFSSLCDALLISILLTYIITNIS
ncbi:uncharacterized protein LOC109846971 [Asparagus officinalis]|uniref:uncharacterized protein LOC109846971 n=1 Tax=Asparagus officinalis TaxID=4686 RepID=UPI00098E621D|nr:uncharacterized protein LOC109846971 [Asparagus officinalis]